MGFTSEFKGLKHNYVADDISPLMAEDYNDSIMTARNNKNSDVYQ
jgi:hypothetical protein